MNHRGHILIAASRALLGKVTPNLRHVSCNCVEDGDKVTVAFRFYHETEPSEDEVELCHLFTTYFIADFPPNFFLDEEFVVSAGQITSLENAVYYRYEGMDRA